MGLLLQGPWNDIVVGSTSALVGVAALAISMTGAYRFGTRIWLRAVLGVGGLLLVHPAPQADIVGMVLVLIALALRTR
jgi:TRAP-type uncharacterized transport system fused permease subunit